MSITNINRNISLKDNIALKIQQHGTALSYYKHNQGLYDGHYNILNKTVSDMEKSNNKIPVNFARIITDTLVSYCANVTVNHKIDDDIQDITSNILSENDFPTILHEALKEAGVKGKSYLLCYLDEFGDFKITQVVADQVIPGYDVNNNITECIRYYTIKDYFSGYDTLYVEYYTKNEIIKYERNYQDIGLIETSREPNKLNFMPIVEFKLNKEGRSILQDIEPLIEAFNKVLSLQLDEFESLRSSYMVLKNVDLSPEAVKMIKESNIIQLMQDGSAEFMLKNVTMQGVSDYLDRLEDLIYRISSVPNLSDKNFASNQSGVSIRYKLMAMENTAMNIQRLGTGSIKKLLQLMKIYILFKTNKAVNVSEYDINWTRNIAQDTTEQVNNAKTMVETGIISQETILGTLGFVKDAQKEIEAVSQQNTIVSSLEEV